MAAPDTHTTWPPVCGECGTPVTGASCSTCGERPDASGLVGWTPGPNGNDCDPITGPATDHSGDERGRAMDARPVGTGGQLVNGPVSVRDWLGEQFDAGREWARGELHADSVAAWWTTGWLIELADATTETAWAARDAVRQMRAEQ